jgi:hypothetical protein
MAYFRRNQAEKQSKFQIPSSNHKNQKSNIKMQNDRAKFKNEFSGQVYRFSLGVIGSIEPDIAFYIFICHFDFVCDLGFLIQMGLNYAGGNANMTRLDEEPE